MPILIHIDKYYSFRSVLTVGDGELKSKIASNIDIKAKTGYVVAVPAVHPDGTGVYQFEPGKSFDEIEVATLPDSWITFIKKTEECTKNLPVGKEPKSTNMTPSAGIQWITSPDKQLLKRAEAYIDKMPIAIDGNWGQNALLRVATVLVIGFTLHPEIAAKLAFETYNNKCLPPWREDEWDAFYHKFTEAAMNKKNYLWGYLLNAKKKANFSATPAKQAPTKQEHSKQDYPSTEILAFYTERTLPISCKT